MDDTERTAELQAQKRRISEQLATLAELAALPAAHPTGVLRAVRSWVEAWTRTLEQPEAEP